MTNVFFYNKMFLVQFYCGICSSNTKQMFYLFCLHDNYPRYEKTKQVIFVNRKTNFQIFYNNIIITNSLFCFVHKIFYFFIFF